MPSAGGGQDVAIAVRTRARKLTLAGSGRLRKFSPTPPVLLEQSFNGLKCPVIYMTSRHLTGLTGAE